MTESKFIVFFDGTCGLCSKSVDWLLARDSKHAIAFAPLQGETAKKLLSASDREDLDSVVVWDHGRTFRRSEAALKALQQLGPKWNLLAAFINFVPTQVRDLAYRMIAANRYQFFGKSETCRVPTALERTRFLE